MKKIYLICGLALFLGISAGISFFLIRDANAKIPANVTLINQNNEDYNFGKDKTKLKLVEFIYTHCPDICPTTTQKMVGLKNDLVKSGVFGKEIEFITITIDPYRDTPEVLKGYMNGFEINNNDSWQFLTGDKQKIKEEQQKIKQVTGALQFQYKDPGNGQFIHSTFTYLVDENNKFIEKFPMGKEFNKKEVYNKIMDEIK
ncbi:SCO family protein [Paenibacillus sp. BSR1-1]|uniref:SCO family protein n=1 Tax=Paenibacillus sp. BSR1-1 TaxID=3020845 RepID=UPI0025AF310B|nr:SCO family protein [Paenibacillus sp. BSR1-1]MDN3019309.1 SCO family protein [Paenibacillus sp. BSR1-1]